MKYCGKCGALLEENQQFCSACGEKIKTETVDNDQVVQQETAEEVTPTEPAVQHSMKWFKFLIYFSLFASAVLNVIYGLNYLTGTIYASQTNGETTAELVYSLYGSGLKVLDVVYGLALIALAAYVVYTRFQLAKYKVKGPKCLYAVYAADAVLSVIYSIGLLATTGINQLISSSTVSTIIVAVVFIILNRKYFEKRKDLFINE